MRVRRQIPGVLELYNPSPRIGRDGGAHAYIPNTPSPTATRKTNPLQFFVNYACLLSPFAYYSCILCTRPPPRTVSAVQAALPGLFLVLSTDSYFVTDPVLTVIDVSTSATHRFCYRQQQQPV